MHSKLLPIVLSTSFFLASCGEKTTTQPLPTPTIPPHQSSTHTGKAHSDVPTTTVNSTGVGTPTTTGAQAYPSVPLSEVDKNGPKTFTKTLSYANPNGKQEQIDIEVTAQQGIIIDVVATPKAVDHDSKRYQQDFQANIQTKAIGKKISTLSLSAVGGASLTTDAFNEYVKTLN